MPHNTYFLSSYFDNYVEGELVMWKHTTLPFAVHTYQRQCNGGAACHCAITVQSGDDVIKIDSCGPSSPTIELTLYLNGELTPGTTITQYNGGLKYEVTLPTGTVVVAEDGFEQFLTVNIYSSSADKGQNAGKIINFHHRQLIPIHLDK